MIASVPHCRWQSSGSSGKGAVQQQERLHSGCGHRHHLCVAHSRRNRSRVGQAPGSGATVRARTASVAGSRCCGQGAGGAVVHHHVRHKVRWVWSDERSGGSLRVATRPSECSGSRSQNYTGIGHHYRHAKAT